MKLIKIPGSNGLFLNPETKKFIYGGQVCADQSDGFTYTDPEFQTEYNWGELREKYLPKPDEELDLDEPLDFDKLREREERKLKPLNTNTNSVKHEIPETKHEVASIKHETDKIKHEVNTKSKHAGIKNSKAIGTYYHFSKPFQSSRELASHLEISNATAIKWAKNNLKGCSFKPKFDA